MHRASKVTGLLDYAQPCGRYIAGNQAPISIVSLAVLFLWFCMPTKKQQCHRARLYSYLLDIGSLEACGLLSHVGVRLQSVRLQPRPSRATIINTSIQKTMIALNASEL